MGCFQGPKLPSLFKRPDCWKPPSHPLAIGAFAMARGAPWFSFTFDESDGKSIDDAL